MTKEQMIATLEAQLASLKETGDFSVLAFQVWSLSHKTIAALGSALIRRELCSWSWGHCRSQTCSHNSHDPFARGETAFIACRQLAMTNKYSSQGHSAP